MKSEAIFVQVDTLNLDTMMMSFPIFNAVVGVANVVVDVVVMIVLVAADVVVDAISAVVILSRPTKLSACSFSLQKKVLVLKHLHVQMC